MSRERDPFRIHVHILPNNKWVCNFCGYEHRGSKTAIRAHLAGVAGYGIQGCRRVDDQVRSEALTALNGKRAVKSSNIQGNVEECPHPLETVNDEDDWMVTSFAALPNLSTDVISTVGPSSSAFPPLPETVNNKDDWTDDWVTLPEDHWAVTLSDAWSDLSSSVISTVGASSSTFLPKTNLRNQSLPARNVSPHRAFPFWPRPPQPHAVDSYIQPRNLSHLINQRDLVPEDLTNMLSAVNAEVEEPNTEVPQGTLSRDHTKKIKYGSFDRKDSLPNGGIGWQKIGKIDYCSRKEIAKGSNGTIVLEGIYEGRPVAVKRLVRAHCDVASNEIQILRAHDGHKNIVRYHGVESNSEFVYLALERCACSLDELIQAHSDSSNNSVFPGDPASTDDYKIKLDSIRGMMPDVNLWRADGYPSPLLRKLMRHVVKGLSYLHDSRIIHRDLKPRNVLITRNQPFCAQLSDMAISKYLPEDKSSLGYHDTGCGTLGWRAPELLRHGGRQTRAMDVFSLGCVLCFFFTRGRHPFGENLERDYNIVYNKMDLSFVDIPEAHDLFSCLLNQDPKLRPEASEVLYHPFFWSSKTRLSFLSDVSDIVEFETRAGNLDLLNALESTVQSIFVGNWEDKIEPAVRAELWRRRCYDCSLVRHLLRAVRNVYSHHMEFPEEVKEILGPVADGLDYYFAIRFPRLLIESYRVVSQICRREELLARVLSK